MSNVHLGHKARKRFGQNFLNDNYVIDQIVSAIAPTNDDVMVEIGPGLGALTEPVCEIIDQLTVVELDRDLAKRLRQHPFMSSKLTVIEADALQYDFSELAKQGSLKVFGNLPYNISTPLMFHLFTFTNQIKEMHFMLQKEVVDRLTAEPGNKTWSRMSVMTQIDCTVEHLFDVPPEAFYPPPKVQSAIVRLAPRVERYRPECPRVQLSSLVQQAFSQRRKTLRNNLKGVIDESEIEALGIDPSCRAETLSLDQLVDLALHH